VGEVAIELEVELAVDEDSVVLFILREEEDVSDSGAVTIVDPEADVESEVVIFAADNIEMVDVASDDEIASVPEDTVSVVEPELLGIIEDDVFVGLPVRFVSTVIEPEVRVVDSMVV